MSDTTTAQKGQRKLRATAQAGLLLLVGLALAAFAKCPPELYFAYAIGVTGNTGVFMWGNSNEHKAAAPAGK
jgi:hypothetical protein